MLPSTRPWAGPSSASSATDPVRAALADLVEAIRQLEGLTGQVGPVRLARDAAAQAPQVVAAACRTLGVPLSFDVARSDGLAGQVDHSITALGAEIRRAQSTPGLPGLGVEEVVERVCALKAVEDRNLRVHSVRRPDATLVKVIDAGPRDAPCLLISPACAMSHRLALPWILALGDRYRCLVPETRGTSWRIEDPSVFDRRGHDVHLQSEDLMAVIETLTSGPVHLMGMCGGAVPGLMVADRQPDYVRSMSLWHADLELGPEAPKTDHQRNLLALLDMAAESRPAAAALREMIVASPLAGVPDRIGPLVVRPYASTELLYRYANLVRATMHWDSRQTAAHVRQPTLVVTSEDDHTAHPEGSLRLAQILRNSRVVVTEHGTHLDAFAAAPDQVATLTSFLDESGLPWAS